MPEICPNSLPSNENTAEANISRPINLLVTLNSAYLHQLNVMLCSLLKSNPERPTDLYILHSSLTEAELALTRKLLGARGRLIPINVHESDFSDAPTTDRYPPEMYYRIFAAKYLPEKLDRVLYLDPDIAVIGDIGRLYDMTMGDNLIAAATHVGRMMTYVNSVRLDSGDKDPYINSGVMLMNLSALREQQNEAEVFSYIEKHRSRLVLPDQDIISGLYGASIVQIDPYIYNMTERLFALHPTADAWLNIDWIRKNTSIIHYCGKNKPWKASYVGRLDVFYRDADCELERLSGDAISQNRI